MILSSTQIILLTQLNKLNKINLNKLYNRSFFRNPWLVSSFNRGADDSFNDRIPKPLFCLRGKKYHDIGKNIVK